MRISGPPATPHPAPPGAGRTERADTAKAFPLGAAEPAGSPDPVAGSDTPSGARSGGVAGAADHSHRSGVATLRQWINHPELRDALGLPDLTAEHHGDGFQKAVEAYQAAAAVPPVVDTDPLVDPTVPADTGAATGV